MKRRQRTHAASGGASEALPHEVGARPSRSEPKLNTHALYPSRSELRGITFKNKLIIFKQICAENPQKYTQSKRESLLQEAVELGLLFKGRNSSFDSMPGHPIDSLYDLWHSESVQVIGVGCDLYRLMELGKIDDGKLGAIAIVNFS